jgi:hypothetical protein
LRLDFEKGPIHPSPLGPSILTGICSGNASERAAGEDLGEDDPDMWVPSVSVDGMVTGWQAGSRVEMGRGRCRAGPAAEKTAHDGFSILEFFFHLTFQGGEKIK